MLIENSKKNIGTWKTIKKRNSALDSKINPINYEPTTLKNIFNTFATSNNEFIKVTEDEWHYIDNVMIDNNP